MSCINYTNQRGITVSSITTKQKLLIYNCIILKINISIVAMFILLLFPVDLSIL